MNVHSSGGYFMWPPGAYKADRTTLPYPPYGTLNYFDQTASSVLERIYSFRHTAILPAADRPGHRRPLLRRRQLRRRGVLQPRHHRLRLRDRRRRSAWRTARPRPPASSPRSARCRSAATPASPTRATTRAWSSPTATTRCCTPRWTTPTTRRAPVLRGDRRDAVQRARRREVHDRRGGLDLLHDRRLDADHGLHRVEAEPAARAAGSGRDRRQHDAEVDRGRLQGQHLRGAVEDVT